MGFCWTWQGTLQLPQLILLVNIHMTTCEELSHNTSGQNDYLHANILGRSRFENMAIYGVHQQTKTLDLTLLILLFCYFVGLHSNNKYFNFSWIFWYYLFFLDNQAFNLTEKLSSERFFSHLGQPDDCQLISVLN